MLKYNGLRRRPTYDELIYYLQYKQETIRYPNRVRFKPYALLEDMYDDARKQLRIEHQYFKSMFDKSMQTDPYMHDKSFQIDDGIDYDQFFSGKYKILDETVESYVIRQKKTQTKRFEPIIKQLQTELEQPYADTDDDFSFFGYPSLLHLLFGPNIDTGDQQDIEHETSHPTPEHTSPSSHQSTPLSQSSYSARDPTASSSCGRFAVPSIDPEVLNSLKSSLSPFYGFF